MKTTTMILMCTFLVLTSNHAWSTEFRVGFAKVEITPADVYLPINIGGYLGEEADEIRDDLYARSVVIEDENGRTIALTYLDLPGISNRIIGNILEGVDIATDISPYKHFIGATHTHSGPDLQGLYGGVTHAYKRYVEAQAIEAVKQAHGNLTPAKMWVSKAIGRNRNRRDWGFTDTGITLVEFENLAGETIGSILNFAAHPVIQQKDKKISRDFCGYVVDRLEATLGGTAIFINGVVGDVLPDGDIQVGDLRAKEYGHEIANEAITASQINRVLIDPPQITVERMPWDLTVTGFLFNLAYIFGLLDYDGRWENQKLKILTTLAYLRFGNQLQAVAFPGESLTRNGFDDGIATPTSKAIKEAMITDHKMFLGLTGDGLGYFVPSDEWWTGRSNNYHELVSPGKAAGDEGRDMLIEMIEADNSCLQNPVNCP